MLVPGLAADFSGYADDVFPSTPALSRWLGRSKRIAFPYNDIDSASCALFGLDATQPPVAALGYLSDFSETPPGVCFRLDPVHLRADTSGLVLFTAASAAISEPESRALFETVKPSLDEAGWVMRYGAADCWYVSGETFPPVPETSPLMRVVGQPVSACLPKGKGADDWLRRINELQMLLHNHEANQQRASQRQALLNGLWLWGGGVMPSAVKANCSQVQTTRSVLSGLAKLHGVTQVNGMIDARSLPSGESVLLDLDACDSAAVSGDVQDWCESLLKLEHTWFKPLLDALMRGRVRQLDLLPLDGFRYPLQRSDLLAFWRRKKCCRDLRQYRSPDRQA